MIVTTSVFSSTEATARLMHKQLTQLAPVRKLWQWLMSIATENLTLLSQTMGVTPSVFSSTQATARLLHKQLIQQGPAHIVWQYRMSIATVNPILLSQTMV